MYIIMLNVYNSSLEYIYRIVSYRIVSADYDSL